MAYRFVLTKKNLQALLAACDEAVTLLDDKQIDSERYEEFYALCSPLLSIKINEKKSTAIFKQLCEFTEVDSPVREIFRRFEKDKYQWQVTPETLKLLIKTKNAFLEVRAEHLNALENNDYFQEDLAANQENDQFAKKTIAFFDSILTRKIEEQAEYEMLRKNFGKLNLEIAKFLNCFTLIENKKPKVEEKLQFESSDEEGSHTPLSLTDFSDKENDDSTNSNEGAYGGSTRENTPSEFDSPKGHLIPRLDSLLHSEDLSAQRSPRFKHFAFKAASPNFNRRKATSPNATQTIESPNFFIRYYQMGQGQFSGLDFKDTQKSFFPSPEKPGKRRFK